MSKVICVVGPTASGKTALAVNLALALNGEVVSCDSMQIYHGMDIGTAKPTEREMCGIRHHMISVCDPSEGYSVFKYVEDAEKCIRDIQSRGKRVIIAGGTGLYATALVSGRTFPDTAGSKELRLRLEKLYDKFGADRLYKLLETRDHVGAVKLHQNDKKRVVRALEIAFSGGKKSEHDRTTSVLPPKYDALWVGLNYRDRSLLYSRIDARVDEMLAIGLMDEVKEYSDENTPTSAQAIGYKELLPTLEKPELFDECVGKLKQSTRRYAKRQLTWFRNMAEVKWFYRDEQSDVEILRDSTETAVKFLYNQ